MTTSERARTRAARLAALLESDGSLTPTSPQTLTQTNDLEADYLAALTAESIGTGLKTARLEAGLSGLELAKKRGLTKGRLSQLESESANPQLSSISEQANALDYDVTIVFTPRQKGKREVRIRVS